MMAVRPGPDPGALGKDSTLESDLESMSLPINVCVDGAVVPPMRTQSSATAVIARPGGSGERACDRGLRRREIVVSNPTFLMAPYLLLAKLATAVLSPM